MNRGKPIAADRTGRALPALWVGIAIVAMSSLGLAQETAERPTKVGTIDLRRAVEGTVSYQQAAEQWTAEMTTRTAVLQERQAELQQAQEQLQAGQATLPPTELATLNRNINRMQTDLARMNEDVQADLNTLRQELLLPITQKVDQVIVTYAQEHGLTVIIDISNPDAGVAFANEAVDITDPIIELLDAAVQAEPGEPNP